jgi:vancomycin resistance protein YoaR
VFDGNYDEWVLKQAAIAKAAAALPQKPAPAAKQSQTTKQSTATNGAVANGASGNKQKSQSNNKAKSQSDPFAALSLEELEKQTAKLAADLEKLDNTIAKPETARDHKKLAALLADREKLVTRHQACEHSWLARAQ